MLTRNASFRTDCRGCKGVPLLPRNVSYCGSSSSLAVASLSAADSFDGSRSAPASRGGAFLWLCVTAESLVRGTRFPYVTPVISTLSRTASHAVKRLRVSSPCCKILATGFLFCLEFFFLLRQCIRFISRSRREFLAFYAEQKPPCVCRQSANRQRPTL